MRERICTTCGVLFQSTSWENTDCSRCKPQQGVRLLYIFARINQEAQQREAEERSAEGEIGQQTRS